MNQLQGDNSITIILHCIIVGYFPIIVCCNEKALQFIVKLMYDPLMN